MNQAHEDVMRTNKLPLNSTDLSSFKAPFFPTLPVRMRVVDFMSTSTAAMFVTWARHIGIEVAYSHAKLQIGFACGCIAGKVAPLLHDAQSKEDFMTLNVSEAASMKETREQYAWLEDRGRQGDIDYSADTYPESTDKRVATVSQGLNTPYLTGDEVSYLVQMNSNGDKFKNKNVDGSFKVPFTPALARQGKVCPVLTFYGAKERVSGIIRTAEESPPSTKQFDVLVANTDATGSGQHWFTVALEVTRIHEPY